MGQGIGALAVFIIVTLLGTLWFGTTLSRHAGLELFIMAVLVVVGLIILFGAAAGASWAWPLGVLYFAASALNLTLIYWVGQEAFLQFEILLGWTALGLLHSSFRIGASEPRDVVPYGGQPNLNLENVMPAPKTRRLSQRPTKRRKAKPRKR